MKDQLFSGREELNKNILEAEVAEIVIAKLKCKKNNGS